MSRTLEFIPIAKVVANGDNPRTTTNEATLEELVESVKRHGVLMPVLVDEPDKKGNYHLQAGGRRLAAAKKAGLKDIPAQIGKVDDGILSAAVTENVLREDLTPLEEAAALKALQEQSGVSARELAKRLGKSKDWVADRLRLVTLPEPVQEAIAKGDIGLHAVPAIARLAEASPKAAEGIVREVSGDDASYDGRDIEDPRMFLEILAEAIAGGDAGLWRLNSIVPHELPVEDGGKLTARLKKANQVLSGWGSESLRFDQDDVDAARAFGCLFEIERPDFGGVTRPVHFVTDLDWLADRVRLKVDYLATQAAKKKPSAAAAKGDDQADDAALKEQRRKEREKEAKARITARGHNLELGVKTAKAFKSPKLTLDVVKLLALLAVHGEAGGLGKRGLRYVDEQLQTVETKKNGSQKITYPGTVSEKLILDAIAKAKTPEEAAGVVLRAYVCATYASEDVVANSSRAFHRPRGDYDPAIKKLLAKVADKVVPPALKRGRR